VEGLGGLPGHLAADAGDLSQLGLALAVGLLLRQSFPPSSAYRPAKACAAWQQMSRARRKSRLVRPFSMRCISSSSAAMPEAKRSTLGSWV